MQKFVLTALLTILLPMMGCVTAQDRPNICPEQINMKCLLPLQCDYDEKRNCDVCKCEDIIAPYQQSPYQLSDPNNPSNQPDQVPIHKPR